MTEAQTHVFGEPGVLTSYVVTPYRFWLKGEKKPPQNWGFGLMFLEEITFDIYSWNPLMTLVLIGKDLVLDWKRPCFGGPWQKIEDIQRFQELKKRNPVISRIKSSLFGSNMWRHVCDVEFSMANE